MHIIHLRGTQIKHLLAVGLPLEMLADIATVDAWEPDEVSSSCRLCDAEFNVLLRRRHHCRICGRLVCADCSRKLELIDRATRVPGLMRACSHCERTTTDRNNRTPSITLITPDDLSEVLVARDARTARPSAAAACSVDGDTTARTISSARQSPCPDTPGLEESTRPPSASSTGSRASFRVSVRRCGNCSIRYRTSTSGALEDFCSKDCRAMHTYAADCRREAAVSQSDADKPSGAPAPVQA